METKHYELTLFDRLFIDSALPEKAGFPDVVIIIDLRDKIKITQAEIKQYNVIALPGGRVTSTENAIKSFQFTDLEERQIISAFKRLEGERSIPTDRQSLDCYNKFVK